MEESVPSTVRMEVRDDVDWRCVEWADVVRENSTRVYRLAYRLTGNVQDAEDLTQDVFVRVFRGLSDYEPGAFGAWLRTITTNLFLDQARRRARIRFDALDEAMAWRLPAAQADTPDRGFEYLNLDRDVSHALQSLSPDFRAAVILADIEGMSYDEIARTLGIKPGTVRSRIHRGRAVLRDALPHRAPRPAA